METFERRHPGMGVRPTFRAQAFAAHYRELLPELSSYDKSLVPVATGSAAAGPGTNSGRLSLSS